MTKFSKKKKELLKQTLLKDKQHGGPYETDEDYVKKMQSVFQQPTTKCNEVVGSYKSGFSVSPIEKSTK